MQTNTCIDIKSQKLAGYLMMRGFVLKELKPNITENTKRNIFMFNNTYELNQAINDYKKINYEKRERKEKVNLLS